jgi:predicted RNA-binding protein with RPS1 domain
MKIATQLVDGEETVIASHGLQHISRVQLNFAKRIMEASAEHFEICRAVLTCNAYSLFLHPRITTKETTNTKPTNLHMEADVGRLDSMWFADLEHIS